MKKILPLLSMLFIFSFANAQLVINELDSDTESIDDKEFIEIKSDVANFPLDGYVVVLFNGSTSGGDTSYYTIDLSGYTTDVNGLLLIGSNTVTPTPQYLISANVIQNGADAVAIYDADYNDFPEGTLATTNNLVDALVYGTGDSDATSLMNLLGVTQQIDEDANNNKDFESIQLANDGSYFVATPTPRQLNDGSGVVLNGLSFNTTQDQYNEGDTFVITFTTEEPVDQDLIINFSLDNNGFNQDDFTGNTTPIIPEGDNTISTTITLVDDNLDEGDEELVISVAELPEGFFKLNDNLLIRVVDNDFTVAPWGTPTNPTFDVVASTQPDGYYNTLDGLATTALRQALQDIIADPDVVRTQTYADVYDILKEADQNPENSNEVWLVYTEQGRPKLDIQTTSDNTGTWNREHTYPRSRGGFYSIEDDDFADGPEVFWTTNADSLRHGNSDAHALRAVDGPENSSRGNQNYGPAGYDGPVGTLGSFKGDVARSVLYMAVRYNDLSVVDGYPSASITGELGDLETLLDWHRNDPPDDYEMNRNNIVYTWQYNRNPFIDQPDLVEYIWGNQVGEEWDQDLAVAENEIANIKLYPNPTRGAFTISGVKEKSTMQLFTLLGEKIYQQEVSETQQINLNLSSGIYLVKLFSKNNSTTKKLIVK